jgi:hypothetical protein
LNLTFEPLGVPEVSLTGFESLTEPVIAVVGRNLLAGWHLTWPRRRLVDIDGDLASRRGTRHLGYREAL